MEKNGQGHWKPPFLQVCHKLVLHPPEVPLQSSPAQPAVLLFLPPILYSLSDLQLRFLLPALLPLYCLSPPWSAFCHIQRLPVSCVLQVGHSWSRKNT